MLGIAEAAREKGYRCITACPDGRSMRKRELKEHLFIGTRLGKNLHIVLAALSGLNGCFSVIDTALFLRKLKKLHPDIIHLHNLHNCYINLPLLFRYIKAHNIPAVWTLHDCWAMTGKCPHFAYVGCDRWKSGCHHCPQLSEYPKTYVDTTSNMWRRKKRWFCLPKQMTIVTPSQWLADLAEQSFLAQYPIRVIPNGIDLSIFRPVQSTFRSSHGLEGKWIVLGVAFDWGVRKGLDVFAELAKRLDSRFQIVLVGTNEAIEKQLPDRILTIKRTQSQKELAQLYTAADVFVNPTREEVLGLVNLEALACGTPVITYRTGGSPECIDETCGSVAPYDDIDSVEKEIIRICSTKPYSPEACRKRASLFDKKTRFMQYVKLYEEQNDGSRETRDDVCPNQADRI